MSTTNESIWNDIRRRGIGTDIKQEDNVNNMGIDDFVDYLVANYRDKVYSMDKDHFCKEYEMDIVVDPIKDIVIYGSYVEDELARIMVVLRNRGVVRHENAIQKMVGLSLDQFDWEKKDTDKFVVKEKDGKDATNQTYVDLIEFFLNNEIFESVWGDIRRRGNGSEVKQEDDVPPHLKKVLSRYIEMFAYRCYYQGDYTAESAPDFRAFVRDFANNPRIEELHPNISELINYFEHMDVWNNVVLPLILKAVEKVDNGEKILADKLWNEIHSTNESVWNDIRRRGNGEEVKKEDDVNNMDIDAFYEYLKKFDSLKVYIEPNTHSFISIDEIILSSGKHKGLYISIDFSSSQKTINLPYSFSENYEGVYDKMLEEYSLEIPEFNTPDEEDDALNTGFIEISPRGGGEITNKFFLEVLNFILRNSGLSGLNESVWNDIRKRGNGVKKAEDIIHLDDKCVDKFKTCLRWFVESIVYCEKCENDFNDFKESVKTNSGRLGEVWKGNTTIPLSDILLPYIEDNWDQYDNIKKQIDDLIKMAEKEINNLGFKKEPGKTIEDTLCEWWNSLDDDRKYDIIVSWCEDDIMSRFYERHLDDDEFTGEDLDPDEEWDGLSYPKQIKIYMEESKTNESVWNDIRKRSNGDEVKKEDDMTSDDFLMLRETAKMFRNVINSEVGKRYSIRVNGGKLFYIDDCNSFIKYILARKKEHFWNDIPDESYDKVMKFVEKNWKDCNGIQEFIDTYLSHLNECEGVPGGVTPANVGGMGAAYFPGPNGEPGSGDLPMPTGHVYHQVAPFGVFIKELKSKKKKKKKFRKEDEPCAKYDNPPIYKHVDDFRDYVDRTYTMVNKKK